MNQAAETPGPSIGSAQLHAALEGVLTHYFGAKRHIQKLVREPSEYYSSFPMEELDVYLDDGTAIELMFKNVSWHAILEVARRVKPAFLYDPLREIKTYQTILAPHSFGTPICYGAFIDHKAGDYWLFLERVAGEKLWQVGEFRTWQQAARWLADLHSHFARDMAGLKKTRAGQLLHYDGNYYRLWLERARAFLHQSRPSAPERAGRLIEKLGECYESVIEHLVELPATFIHGEFYPSNVLVRKTDGSLRICPVDWEMAAVGPGLMDLAALTSGSWSERQKMALVSAYYGTVRSTGGWPPPLNIFLTSLDFCHLHLAVQWLGWSLDWSPPREHARNWLREAMRLIKKLGF
jgi:hypothetical protein